MTRVIFSGLFIFFVLFATQAIAKDEPLTFKDAALEARYYDLIEEVRCLVCQNQSLADSNADLAQDLRNEIYKKVLAGEENKQIITFLVERYGDFVLYRPPMDKNTWLLWFGPFLLLLIGFIAAVIIIKKQSSEEEKQVELDIAQQQRLQEILEQNENKENNS